MIPSTTRYLGTNFIIESHMLERPKFKYNYSDMYVGIMDRREASVIFMQQFLGAITKFSSPKAQGPERKGTPDV
jgi:hypothetical protein